jgi:Domain of unknown function (DU1801)
MANWLDDCKQQKYPPMLDVAAALVHPQREILLMKNSATTVEEYLQSLPTDRREAINAVRKAILGRLPEGYVECMSYGMIGYVVPHSLYPAGYHCDPKLPLPYACLGSQKNHMALHLMTVYGDPAMEKWFRKTWIDAGKKLDMGKACVRFRKLEDVPLDVVGQLIARVPVKEYIFRVEKLIDASASRRGKTKPKKSRKAN